MEAIKSGTDFYVKRIYDMIHYESLTEFQLFALYNEMYLTAIRKDEYKVPLAYFREECKDVGLAIKEKIKLWPLTNVFASDSIGDFIVVLQQQ